MKAILVEGVAGSGKTTYIADDVKNHWIAGAALLLTFSRTGRAVLQLYLGQRQVTNAAVYTIDGFASKLLTQLGDTRFVLRRDKIEKELLPSLYEQVADQMLSYAQATDQSIDLPSLSPRLMQELMEDIDFYRASCAFEYDDDEMLESLLEGKLNHHWRLVRRLFSAYEAYREAWHPNLSSHDNSIFELDDEQQGIYATGEQGFRSLGEAVYDLLRYVEDSDILEKIGQRYTQQFIDEFHDTTPLQLKFILKLAKSAKYVVAVGDRFQNIFAWRGTNTAIVFDEFTRTLGAEKKFLNHSYRYGQNIANLAQSIIHRPIESKASHNSRIVKSIPTEELAKVHRETVIISQDFPSQIQAAFTFFSHTKHKIALNINHSVGVSILNILCVLRYDYLLDPKSKLVKNIALDFHQFLQLPQCLLSETAKQEMLANPSLDRIRMYFDIHLNANQERAYHDDFATMLRAWLSGPNREHELIYTIMTEIEQTARLWSIHSQRIYDRINRAAWDALKEDARLHQYTLAQWPERANLLTKRWNDREGIRFATVSQAKGREYDSVLIYDVNQFSQPHDELSCHQFYIAITRAKKELTFYQAPSLVNSTQQELTHSEKSVSYNGQQKTIALAELKKIKEYLQKNRISS